MEWNDEAIVLAVRRHGETGALASLLTRDHGRHLGLVLGGGAKAGRAALQTGNHLKVTWKARLAEQLGSYSWELLNAFGTLWLDDVDRLAAISSLCALCETLLAERQPHAGIFEGSLGLLQSLAEADWPGLYAHWELGFLAEEGYRLDLTRCAQTGITEDLVYVSPKSGRAVSRVAGAPYHDRLLPLPAFLREGSPGSRAEVSEALRLTGYFLEKYLLAPHGRQMPPGRSRLVERFKA